MGLQKYLIKRLLTNPATIGWGFLFIVFWAVLGAFVESSSIPSHLPTSAYQFYTAGWYGVLEIISFSAASVSIVFAFTYQTGAIPYLIRYSKMKGIDYLSGLLASGLVTGLAYGLLLLVLVYALYSYHFGVSLTPANVPMIVGVILLFTLFFSSFSILLGILKVKYLGLSQATGQIVNYIPLILGYGFGIAALYVNLGDIVYATPFTSAEYLLMQGYYGHKIPLNIASYSSVTGSMFSPVLGVISIVAWTAIVLALSIFLFTKIYYRSVYEGQIM